MTKCQVLFSHFCFHFANHLFIAFVTSLYQPVGNEADFKKNFCFYKSLDWSPLSGFGKGMAVGETVTGEPGINKTW